eukprot:scaffold229258_cov33-Tisochrysis_lutea.AAC.3
MASQIWERTVCGQFRTSPLSATSSGLALMSSSSFRRRARSLAARHRGIQCRLLRTLSSAHAILTWVWGNVY